MHFIKIRKMALTSSLIFHNDSELNFENGYFGKLEINVEDGDMPQHMWDIKFSIDCSGSMSDICNDGKTKMQHIQHTMINILHMFAEYDSVKFNISISIFDDAYELLLDFTEINDTNLHEMKQKIDKIYPRNSTDLILPLKQSNIELKNRKMQYPENKQLHVLLTDGCDTCNDDVYKKLETLCSETDHAFIAFGFGVNHDANALSIMCNNINSDYGFIDELEKAGLVYGEYLHAVLYKIFYKLTITIENGEIYDWKTNTWSSSLMINHLDSGASKTYYVKTQDKNSICGTITGMRDSNNTSELLDEFTAVPDLIEIVDGIEKIVPVDLTPHLYRYRTLKLMAEVKASHSNEEFDDEQKKKEIKDFYEEIKHYMEKQNMENDLFMKKLKDDVFILYKTLGTSYYELYSGARQRSQGYQHICTATQINTLDTVPYLVRYARTIKDFSDSDADTEIENVVFDNAAYETICPRSVSNMMRSISKK